MAIDTIRRKSPFQEKEKRKIGIDTFLRKYRKGTPGVKYEYNRGIIEKTESMRFSEQYIALNLNKVFRKTDAFAKDALLEQELEVWTSKEQWRKPDFAFITAEQIKAASQGFEPMPEFVIEVISKNDKINIVKQKVYEYFAAGVKVLWIVFPALKIVEIYHSPKNPKTLSAGEICSAAPVMEDFTISVTDLYEK